MLINNTILQIIVRYSIYFLPFSIVIGSLIININLLIFIFFGIILLISSKLKFFLEFPSITLLIFFLFNIVNSFLNIEIIGYENFLKSIFFIKFFLFYIVLENLILNNKVNLNIFFIITLFISIFISLDLILQYTTGENILGFKPHDGRFGGMFGAEGVAGSFLQKSFIPTLIGIILLVHPLKKYNLLVQVIIFVSIFTGIIVSNNRISFFIMIPLTLLIIFFIKNFRKSLILSIVIIIPIFNYLFNNDLEIKNRFNKFIFLTKNLLHYETLIHNKHKEIALQAKEGDTNKSIYSDHGKIYNTTLKSFNENKLFGNGIKSFRYKCNKFLKETNTLCSTHPHNYHLEILHDTGIIGFILLFFFVISLLWKVFKKIKFKNLNYLEKSIFTLLIINFLVEIFPLKSTGSFFTTWNGTLIWITISLLNYKFYERNNKKQL